ncbi:hypothetical protein BT69DRAFT_1339803 [Atractiella rhizophila]|nr:hypothetical protein BT69DRAFT_1339803 [Atractiella rhizophila]
MSNGRGWEEPAAKRMAYSLNSSPVFAYNPPPPSYSSYASSRPVTSYNTSSSIFPYAISVASSDSRPVSSYELPNSSHYLTVPQPRTSMYAYPSNTNTNANAPQPFQLEYYSLAADTHNPRGTLNSHSISNLVNAQYPLPPSTVPTGSFDFQLPLPHLASSLGYGSANGCGCAECKPTVRGREWYGGQGGVDGQVYAEQKTAIPSLHPLEEPRSIYAPRAHFDPSPQSQYSNLVPETMVHIGSSHSSPYASLPIQPHHLFSQASPSQPFQSQSCSASPFASFNGSWVQDFQSLNLAGSGIGRKGSDAVTYSSSTGFEVLSSTSSDAGCGSGQPSTMSIDLGAMGLGLGSLGTACWNRTSNGTWALQDTIAGVSAGASQMWTSISYQPPNVVPISTVEQLPQPQISSSLPTLTFVRPSNESINVIGRPMSSQLSQNPSYLHPSPYVPQPSLASENNQDQAQLKAYYVPTWDDQNNTFFTYNPCNSGYPTQQ